MLRLKGGKYADSKMVFESDVFYILHNYTRIFSLALKYDMLLLSQNIKIERCILILGINIEPDDLADLRKSINRLDVYCAASSG